MASDITPLSADGGTLTGRQARLIIDSAVDYAIVGLDLDGVITSWNIGAVNIMGWSSQDAIGQPGGLFFTPEDREAGVPAAEMSAAIRRGRGIDERWHLRKDGSRFWANGEMMPLRGAQGELEGYVKILRDRTEQREAAVALSKSEDRYRDLYEAMDEGFCLIEVSGDDEARPTDYRFVEVNQAFERQTGLADAAGSWMRDLTPDHEQHWFDVYAGIARTGEPARFVLPAQALGGRWYEVFAYRVGAPADRLVAVLFSDITERRANETRLTDSERRLRELNDELRSNEENLRLLLDTIGEGFYAVDRDGVTTTCNAAFLRMMGFARAQDVIGRKLHDVIHHSHPDGSPYHKADCPIYLTASQGTPAHVPEEQFFPIDRAPMWVEYRVTPIVRDGELQGAICTFQDISEHRALEQARKEAEVRRAAILHLGDSLRNMDDLARMSATAAEIAGRTLAIRWSGLGRIDVTDEVIAIEGDWSSDAHYSLIGEHSMRTYGSFIDDLLANRVAVIDDTLTDPRTSAHPEAFADIAVRALINAPVIDRGRLAAIFCIVSDRPRRWTQDEITFVQDVAERTYAAIERRRAEQALQVLADTLQQQVEARTRERDRTWQVSRDMLGVADERGVWLSVNPAWSDILGWPEQAFVGRTSEWLEHPDDAARTRSEIERLASGKTTLFFENRFRSRNGDYRDLSWSAVPTGGLVYCVARDVTEQKQREVALQQAEDQLRQSQKVEAVGQLTGGVAHDFNNLLTVIRSSVDLLRRPALSEEKRRRYIDAISDTADRATRLTSQLLAFARRQTLNAETFDASDSLDAIREMLGTLTGPRVVITIETDAGALLVRADRSQFDTAIVNMVVNARDAMAAQGELGIAIRRTSGIPSTRSHPAVPGSFIAVAITDTGAGIAADQVDRIFEPFFTTKGVGHGTGLGLSQVFGFAKQSRGDISVVSEPDRGSTFTLYLPTAAAQEPLVAARVDEPIVPLAQGACILIVEDNSEVGAFATEALEELGYRTRLAVNGASALVDLGEDGAGFDLVFSDVVMPGMSGIELGHEIHRRFAQLPVVLTSGYSDVLAEQDSHAFTVLQKPYSIDELAKVLARVSADRGGKA